MSKIKEYAFPLIVLFFFAGYFTNTVLQSTQVVEFIQKGGRHTKDQAIEDCKRVNLIAQEISQPVWDCEEIY